MRSGLKWRDGCILCAIALSFSLSPIAVAQTVTIPFHSKDGLLIINVFVNGRDASVILDTASRSTFLAPEAVGLSNTAGVGSLRSNALMVKSISRNAAISLKKDGSIFNQQVTVVNLDELNKKIGSKCDGILGQDFLGNFSAITIHYKSKTVAFTW